MRPAWPAGRGPGRQAGAAVAVAAALAASLVATGPAHLRGILVLLGVLGAAFTLASGALRAPGLVLPGLLALGGAFALLDGLGDVAPVAAVPYGVGLLLLGELADAAGRARPGEGPAAPDVRRGVHLAVVLGGSLLAGFGILAASAEVRAGAAVELAGLLAAIAALGLVAAVAGGAGRRGTGAARRGDERAVPGPPAGGPGGPPSPGALSRRGWSPRSARGAR